VADLPDLIDCDHVASNLIASQTKAYELFEVFDSCSATDFVIVTVEGEANSEVPTGP
jgi:hypothetical protein